FSRQTVDVKKNEIDKIAENLETDRIGIYESLVACGSLTPDIIGSYINDEASSTVSTSLAVSEKYTVFVFDSAGTDAGMTVLAEPVYLSAQTGRSVIRVVHGNYSTGNITLSLGTRYYDSLESGSWDSDSLKYKSGMVLASNIAFGEVSEAMFVPSGIAPITLFTATQPANLLFAGIETLVSEQYYLIVVNQDPVSGEIRLSLIEDTEEAVPVRHIPEGEFTQIVNMVPDADKLSINIPPLIPTEIDAQFYYTSVIATVLPVGSNSINIGGQTFNINAEAGKRELLIATGEVGNIEFIEFNEYPEEHSLDYYKRRFINACKEQDFISVKINKDDE
ncbi:MAG: DUF4397 domain-containing protein, partial [Chlorobi bacterium]|nr:DUF4397 domain-containing protein [Chlorobiota bacterium]